MTSVTAVIPARWQSKRFPGKPLAPIGGVPMVRRVWEQVCQAQVNQVIVATDDIRIFQYCQAEGITVVMTSKEHATGTDRLAEVAESVAADIYINVQGDEPLIEPISINRVSNCLLSRVQEGIRVATGYLLGSTEEQQASPNIVHLVPDVNGCVLSLSRWPVPFSFQEPLKPNIHVGLYAFTPEALQEFSRRARGPVERAESIELLRFLEYGEKVACVPVLSGSIGVDLPEDILIVESRLALQ